MREFLERKLWLPIQALLREGATPERLSWALAWGATISLFPLLGTTTLICVLVGMIFRLNQVALQIANYLVGLLQIFLIPLWIRGGEWIFSLPPVTFNPLTAGKELFASPTLFFATYGASAMAAVALWAVIAPVLAISSRTLLLPVLRKMKR